MMKSLLVVTGILLVLFVFYAKSENQCDNASRLGLLATQLCKDPSTGEPLPNCESAVMAAKTITCCTQADVCPGGDTEIFIDDTSFSLKKVGRRRKRVVISSANEITAQELNRNCPVGWKHCTYNDCILDSIVNEDAICPTIEYLETCTPVEELNEFGRCQQGCEEIPRPISLADLGGRTDTIAENKAEKTCGTRNFESQVGVEAATGEFPWVCSVWVNLPGDLSKEKYLGGCTIIPNNRNNDIQGETFRIITAAHILQTDKADLKVRIRYTKLGDGNFEEDHSVAQFFEHPNFDKSGLKNNIAIMILEKPLDLVKEDGVNAACMPACNNMFHHTFVNGTGVRCWSAGWGSNESSGTKTISQVQRKVDLPIFPDRVKCEQELNNALKEIGQEFLIYLTAGELCAGGEPGKDTCSGDGGSPLVCQSVNGNWHVVGLTSYGIGDCGAPGRPAVYVNVFEYLDFIYGVKLCSDGAWRPTPKGGFVPGTNIAPGVTCE